MMCAWIALVFCTNCFYLAECLIPMLTVRYVDQKLIDRKRQDTLEICRLFNQEIKYLEAVNATNYTLNNSSNNRAKREVRADVDNPLLKDEDIERVESIVDKIYDDMQQNGSPVTYRRRFLNEEDKKKIQSRRFNFAPAELLGPKEDKDDHKILNDDEVKIPWIKKWKHGIVPFFIDPNTYDSILAETILKAFEYIEKVTCIRLQRLRERPTDVQSLQNVEWLYISNPLGLKQCVHSNERKPNSGVQMVVFGYDCLSQGEISHEIMHVLGFSHEHTRSDRDKHIDILWDNIKPGYKKYFEIRKDDPLLVLPYDYKSVLHYPSRAFSKNGQQTVKAQAAVKIGQREALSALDVEKIGMIYGAECVDRNKDYLTKTCPSAMSTNLNSVVATQDEIDKYFENRIWPYALVNYKIRNNLEFTAEEKDNIKAVLKHIEKETCIEFRDITQSDESLDKDDDNNVDHVPFNETEDRNKKNESVTVQNNEKSTVLTEDEETTTNSEHKMTHVTEDTPSHLPGLRHKSDGIVKQAHKKTPSEITKETVKRHGKKMSNRKPSRRHSDNMLIFQRSSQPGCPCPPSGRPNGKTVLNLNADCFNSVNDLLHVLVHVLGLDHQHNMYDRDSYLHILWNDLTPEVKKDMKEKLPPAASVGFPYDYQSVMHYPWLQIKNGSTNIMYPVWNDGWAMGHWQGLSLTDVNKINFLYKYECRKRREEAQK
ncbi:uncharacterized protein LOC116777797 [Danaus plexippus]|uniref:uncharacterized protein LOC116777797 n=1 Tax=Danaus plexippus TaxID=13037 RepID=UPI002AAFC56D|nr:uncharacterized protein LOC116777797 [Danaus plexippus]